MQLTELKLQQPQTCPARSIKLLGKILLLIWQGMAITQTNSDSPGDENGRHLAAWTNFLLNSALLNSKKEVCSQSRNWEYFSNFYKSLSTAVQNALNLWPLLWGPVLIRDLSWPTVKTCFGNMDYGLEVLTLPKWCSTLLTQVTHSTTQQTNFVMGSVWFWTATTKQHCCLCSPFGRPSCSTQLD